MTALGEAFDPSSVVLPCGGLATALALAQAGIAVFPADETIGPSGPSKAPILVQSWKQESTDDFDRIARWWKARPGALVAIDLAKAGLVVIDPDRHGTKDGVAAFESLVAQHGLPEGVPVSVTQSGGRHYIFAQPPGRRLGNREGRLGALGINVRGAGGYIIAPGSVAPGELCWALQDGSPDLCDAYEDGSIPALPEWLCDLIEAKKSFERPETSPPPAGESRQRRQGDDRVLERAYVLTALDAECETLASHPKGGRNNALNRAAFNLGQLVGAGGLSRGEVESALWAAAEKCGLVKDDGARQIRATLSSGLDSGIAKPRAALRDDPPDAAGVFHDLRPRQILVENGVTADAMTGEIIAANGDMKPWMKPAVDADATSAAQTGPRVQAIPYDWPAPDEIPPREWLYGRLLIRRFVTATIAPGGVGKSSLTIAEALAMVSVRPLLHGVAPERALNVWMINLEDPIDELHRRIAATAMHYGIGQRDAVGSLYVASGRDTRIVIAEQTRAGFQIVRPIVEALISEISERAIDVLIVDPFVASHRLSENDNTAIDAVAREWAGIADATGCAVSLVHHSRKTGGAEITVEDARGASALVSASRVARVLNQMSADEAAKAGVENHRAFFRVDNGKSNMAPAGEDATWYQIASVNLGNSGQGENGDSVGVVQAWKWPNPHEGILTEDLREIQKRLSEGSYRLDVQAKQWAGHIVADVLDLDASEASAKIKIKQLIGAWLKSDHLKIVRAPDNKRMMKDFLTIGTPVDYHAPRAAPKVRQ